MNFSVRIKKIFVFLCMASLNKKSTTLNVKQVVTVLLFYLNVYDEAMLCLTT